MIFRRLTFSGIGPFRKTVALNFDEFNADGIFLLDGATGSGKSTIIDAIVFALYGRTANSENTPERLRSTHSSPAEASWVDLVFTVGADTYRVKRSPAYERPKQRGTGTVRVAPHAALWKISEAAAEKEAWDAGEPLCTQSREVGIELKRIIGLSFSQFSQTVILPQGEFEKFLKLSSPERLPLLETLFDSGQYSRFAEMLNEKAKERRNEIAQLHAELKFCVQTGNGQDAFSAGESEILQEEAEKAFVCAIAPTPECDARLLALIAAAVRRKKEESARLTAAKDLYLAAEKEARAKLTEAKILASRQLQAKKYAEEKEALGRQRAAIESISAKLEADSRARPVSEKNTAVGQELEMLMQETQSAADLADALCASGEISAQTPETLRSCIQNESFDAEALTEFSQAQETEYESLTAAAREEKGRIGSYLEAEENLSRLREEDSAVQKELKMLNADLQNILREREELPRQEEDLRMRLKNAVRRSEKLPELNRLTAQTEHAEEQCRLLREAQAEALHLADGVKAAKKRYLDAQERCEKLLASWVGGFTSSLAEKLKPGEPCAVCGSTVHPSPAPKHGEQTDRAAVEEARKETDKYFALYGGKREQLTQLAGRMEELKKNLADQDPERLRVLKEKYSAEKAEAEKEREKIPSLESALSDLEQAAQDLTRRRLQTETQVGAHTAAHNLLKRQIGELREKLDEIRMDGKTVRETLSAAEKKISRLQAMCTGFRQIRQRCKNVNDARQAAREALLESPFKDFAQVNAALLPQGKRQEYAGETEKYYRAAAANEKALAAPEIKEALAAPPAKVAELEEEYAKTEKESVSAAQKAVKSEYETQKAESLAEKISRLSKRWHRETEEAGTLLQLAAIANADPGTNIDTPLGMWVLFRQFEQVVERANEYLQEISNERYELRRTQEEGRTRKKGLGLEIIDHEGSAHGQIRRSVSSLSGGETFYTSLSLALALAETVQEQNGGRQIDTLLIDEGFGTLSDEVREAVMKTLHTLRAHGRVIGIISHVSELKQLIPNRISLEKKADGSSVLRS